MQKTLDKLKIGNKAIIKSLLCEESIRRRLLDIGLIPGTKVKCVLRSPSGDPYAYDIRGCVMAIRNNDAKNIYIEEDYE